MPPITRVLLHKAAFTALGQRLVLHLCQVVISKAERASQPNESVYSVAHGYVQARYHKNDTWIVLIPPSFRWRRKIYRAGEKNTKRKQEKEEKEEGEADEGDS